MSAGHRTRNAAAVLLAGCIVFVPRPASADHGGEGVDPDNKNQSLAKHSLSSRGNTAYVWGDAELGRSVIATSWTAGDADIALYDNDYDQHQWLGQTYCTDWNHNAIGWPTTCDDMTVKLDSQRLNLYHVAVWKHVACHELGHTGDLGHRSNSDDSNDNSCMRADDEFPLSFDSHDLNDIADTF